MRKLGIAVTIFVLAGLSAAGAGGAARPALAAAGKSTAEGTELLAPRLSPAPGPPPTTGAGSQIEPDVSGYSQCEKGKGPLWTPYYADRFQSCFLVHSGFDIVESTKGGSKVVGSWTLQWIVTGAGDNNSQLMTFRVKSSLWKETGVHPGPAWHWVIGLGCVSYFGASCANNHSAGFDFEVRQWSQPRTFTFVFNTSKSPGHAVALHSSADALNYHAMSQWQNLLGQPKSWSKPVYFRGDRARYINGGGSVFYQVMPTWDISLSGKAGAVAKHIQLALTEPGTGSYPPAPTGEKVRIPGSVSTRQPLTRLYPGYDEKIYDANVAAANSACVANWGTNYPQGNKYQCDEYPMAATYEGASQATGNPWWYSVQVLATGAETAAGAQWNAFLVKNRVLSGDQFWVAVVS